MLKKILFCGILAMQFAIVSNVAADFPNPPCPPQGYRPREWQPTSRTSLPAERLPDRPALVSTASTRRRQRGLPQ